MSNTLIEHHSQADMCEWANLRVWLKLKMMGLMLNDCCLGNSDYLRRLTSLDWLIAGIWAKLSMNGKHQP